MAKIQNNIQCLNVLVIEYWQLRLVCYLVLGICIFKHETPRQGPLKIPYFVKRILLATST
jgi:hypothetical protein